MTLKMTLLEPALKLVSFLIVLLSIRVLFVCMTIRRRKFTLDRSTRSSPIKTLVVLGSGGHTTEMLQMINSLDRNMYTPLIYMIASTDDTSEGRLHAVPDGRMPDAIYRIPRSREVGQSYLSSVVTTLRAFLVALWLLLLIRPTILLCNGPGTCLPVAVTVFFYRILGICEGNLVFVESFCRVRSLSLTGRLLYPLSDLFVVHWQELQSKYPRSRTVSTFVANKQKTS